MIQFLRDVLAGAYRWLRWVLFGTPKPPACESCGRDLPLTDRYGRWLCRDCMEEAERRSAW